MSDDDQEPTLSEAFAALADAARLLGLDLQVMKEKIRQLREASHRRQGARHELLYRLNHKLKGKDPEQPVNWRGLR